MQPGLRERKKQEARQRISDTATVLFMERGFDNVTVAEIAEAAGFSKMTVFNYFPRKEDMYLDLDTAVTDLLLTAVRERPAGQPVAEAVRALLHRLLAERHGLSFTRPAMKEFGRVIADSAALRSRAREMLDELVGTVAAVLAEQTADPLGSRLVARLLVETVRTVVTTAGERLIAGDDAAVVTADQAGVIDRAFDLLANGISEFGA